MAPAKKASNTTKTSAAAPPPPPAQEGNRWSNLLNDLNTAGSGDFFFPKTGRTRLRLIPEEGTEDQFFTQVDSVYRGQTKTKYILLAIVLGTDQGPLDEKWVNKVVGVVVSKVVLKGIVQLLAEEYDLLSEEGHGITIVRSGNGQFDTTYTVLPSQKVVPIPEEAEMPEMTLEEMAEEFMDFQARKGDGGGSEEAPANAGKGKGKKTTEASGDDW